MSKFKSIDDFVKIANYIHSSKFSYRVINNLNQNSNIEVICIKHGISKQRIHSHLNSQYGCRKCADLVASVNSRDSKESFINKSLKVHGCLYRYDKVDYVNKRTKVDIICLIHGIFKQNPSNHLSGAGCQKCASEKRIKSCRKSTDIFISEFSTIHNFKYDYSLIEYTNNKTAINIVCPVHGVFKQSPQKHHIGCKICYDKKNTDILFNNFLKNASIIHGNKYDYSLVEYNSNKSKIKIICLIHGIFEQRPDNHLGSSAGCPHCNESKGEKKITEFLNSKNIVHIRQIKFEGCVGLRELPFDFYLPDYNCCIEYDGRQHFTCSEYFGGEESYIKRKAYDEIKNRYCLDNNIDLLRIVYYDYNNIESILDLKLIQ